MQRNQKRDEMTERTERAREYQWAAIGMMLANPTLLYEMKPEWFADSDIGVIADELKSLMVTDVAKTTPHLDAWFDRTGVAGVDAEKLRDRLKRVVRYQTAAKLAKGKVTELQLAMTRSPGVAVGSASGLLASLSEIFKELAE